jgi:hypothetical protein
VCSSYQALFFCAVTNGLSLTNLLFVWWGAQCGRQQQVV